MKGGFMEDLISVVSFLADTMRDFISALSVTLLGQVILTGFILSVLLFFIATSFFKKG